MRSRRTALSTESSEREGSFTAVNFRQRANATSDYSPLKFVLFKRTSNVKKADVLTNGLRQRTPHSSYFAKLYQELCKCSTFYRCESLPILPKSDFRAISLITGSDKTPFKFAAAKQGLYLNTWPSKLNYLK